MILKFQKKDVYPQKNDCKLFMRLGIVNVKIKWNIKKMIKLLDKNHLNSKQKIGINDGDVSGMYNTDIQIKY